MAIQQSMQYSGSVAIGDLVGITVSFENELPTIAHCVFNSNGIEYVHNLNIPANKQATFIADYVTPAINAVNSALGG